MMSVIEYESQCQTYIRRLQTPLYKLVKEETDLRLKHLVLVTNHCTECLRVLLGSNTTINCLDPRYTNYTVNHRIYQNFLSIAFEVIKQKCEKGINFARFKKDITDRSIWNALKGYWFHNVPQLITVHLWIPLLKQISKLYRNIGSNFSNQNVSEIVVKYLHKKFVSCLLQVRCQLNQHSNPSGSLIQASCWKFKSFQDAITSSFDDSNSYTFGKWMNAKSEGKNMRIPQVVSKCIKKHADVEYQTFIQSIGITARNTEFKVNKAMIDSVVMFSARPPSRLTTPLSERTFQSGFQFTTDSMTTRMHRVSHEHLKEKRRLQRQQLIEQHHIMMRQRHYRKYTEHNGCTQCSKCAQCRQWSTGGVSHYNTDTPPHQLPQ
eukprot:1012056_1